MWREQFFASGDAFRSAENRPLPVRYVQKVAEIWSLSDIEYRTRERRPSSDTPTSLTA